jgi:hypothetical protein
VPQGAIWSPKLWNLFVRLLSEQVSSTVFSYADDTALVREIGPEDITEEGIARVTAEVNADLAALVLWGSRWGLTFEASKNEQMVVSKKRVPAVFTGLKCEGEKVKQVSQLRLVGFVFDNRLQWAGMVDRVRNKARARLGALFRMCGVLDTGNRALMYKAFIRSAMEYGCLEYMAAAPIHLEKLDRVQRSAERICGCEFESLGGRRQAAAFGLACKLLDDQGRGELQNFKPQLKWDGGGRTRKSSVRELRMVKKGSSRSLDVFSRSFEGSIDGIFDKIPTELKEKGEKDGWKKIMKQGQRILSGKMESKANI